MSAPAALSYVLPLRMADGAARAELGEYLRDLARWCDDVIVVDGSAPDVFAASDEAWRGLARHVAPDPVHGCANGKVAGVLTGVPLSRHERVIVADDDVRYDPVALDAVAGLLDAHDLVAPQNVFCAWPWHARWDTARTLLNRSLGADFPGTLGVRRSAFEAMGGYSGDVLFENLELMRTVRAHGGRVAAPLDVYVRRKPPTSRHFWGQRVRQAYDDFALPARMACWLALAPSVAAALARRRPGPVLAAGLTTMALAERGRRRARGSGWFPPSTSLLAPLWLAERGVCIWLALGQRVLRGGVRYGDGTIRTAAHSARALRRQARRTSGDHAAAPAREAG